MHCDALTFVRKLKMNAYWFGLCWVRTRVGAELNRVALRRISDLINDFWFGVRLLGMNHNTANLFRWHKQAQGKRPKTKMCPVAMCDSSAMTPVNYWYCGRTFKAISNKVEGWISTMNGWLVSNSSEIKFVRYEFIQTHIQH